ncbi:hypothetical protein [Mucilaginibacter sp. SP1R1]|nr:hypothetical protein [Mucilaginibacter sp. SP1R1]MBB6152402.1 hypothetical protein [Mucilaginibacter sp. SP1R1]
MHTLNKNPKRKIRSVSSFNVPAGKALVMGSDPTSLTTVATTHVFKK